MSKTVIAIFTALFTIDFPYDVFVMAKLFSHLSNIIVHGNEHCYPVNYLPAIKGGRKLSHTMMSIHQQHCIYRAVLDFSTLNIHLLSLATLHLQGGIGF